GGGGAGLAGEVGLATGDGAASALAGAAVGASGAPAASGFGLSDDWGGLGSSAMYPGTIKLQCGGSSKLLEAPIDFTQNDRNLGRAQKEGARTRKPVCRQTHSSATWQQTRSLSEFLTHAVSTVNARQHISGKILRVSILRKAIATKNYAQSNAPFL